MDISNNIKELSSVGFLLNSSFIDSQEAYSAPLSNQVKYYLQQLEGPVKLTARGNLPTKIVKEFVDGVDPRPANYIGTRYIQDDCMSLQRVRIVTETAKLVAIKNNFISLTKKGKDFLLMSDAHQFIFLLEHYCTKVNMSHFDRYEDKGFAQSFALNIIYIVFKENRLLASKEYADILRQTYSQVDELIVKHITPSPYDLSKENRFYEIIEIRIFKRCLELFALVEKVDNSYKASPLLLQMMQNSNKNSIVDIISGNTIKESIERFSDTGYEVDLFFEFFEISGLLASKYEINFQEIVDDAMVRYCVKQTDIEPFVKAFAYYYSLIFNLYEYLLDETRSNEHESVLTDKLHSLSSALYHLLPPSALSAPMLKKIENIIPSLGVVFASYGVDTNTKDFIGEVEAKMGEFVVDKVAHFFEMMSSCSMYVKKNKKVSKDLTHDLKFCIMGYIVVCWDVMIRHEEEA